MDLSDRQKDQYYKQGYCVLRKLIPREMTQRAVRAINHSLGAEGMEKDALPSLRAQTYCPELTQTATITDLVNATDLASAVESLVGAGNLMPTSRGQIGLRFPSASEGTPPAPHGHLDGIGTGSNGSAPGEYSRGFTCFAVVYLQDVPEQYSGNFTVWPGSHSAVESHLRDQGMDVLSRGQPPVDLPHEPIQIRGRAGDVCLAHHQLIHCAAPNGSPHIRYAAIFRLRHVNCSENGVKSMTDIWMEYPGLRSIRRA